MRDVIHRQWESFWSAVYGTFGAMSMHGNGTASVEIKGTRHVYEPLPPQDAPGAKAADPWNRAYTAEEVEVIRAHAAKEPAWLNKPWNWLATYDAQRAEIERLRVERDCARVSDKKHAALIEEWRRTGEYQSDAIHKRDTEIARLKGEVERLKSKCDDEIDYSTRKDMEFAAVHKKEYDLRCEMLNRLTALETRVSALERKPTEYGADLGQDGVREGK